MMITPGFNSKFERNLFPLWEFKIDTYTIISHNGTKESLSEESFKGPFAEILGESVI
jgi:hypothetical protein